MILQIVVKHAFEIKRTTCTAETNEDSRGPISALLQINSSNLLLKHDCSSKYFNLQIKTTFQCYFEYHLQQAGRSKGSSFQLSVCRPWTYKGYPKRAAATSPMNLTRTQSVQAVQSLWLSKQNLAESSVKPSQYMNACPYRPNRSGR